MKKERYEKENKFGVCPFVTAQRLLAGKWAILILESLAEGPKRFNQIQKEIDITQITVSKMNAKGAFDIQPAPWLITCHGE